MAGRQSAPNLGYRFAACAAMLLAIVWHAGPAAAAANTSEMCDDAGKRPFEISGSDIAVLDVDANSTDIGQSESDADALLPANYLSPQAEAALRELLEDTKKASPESPVADAPRVDGGKQPAMKARVPGVSDNDLARYKRQMYRRDI